MTAIPKDIEAKAFEIAAKIPSTEAARPFIASLIAEALKGRDERCAVIALEHARILRKSYANDSARAVECVASAIRGEGA